jgi:predicted nuclease with TOPRIM domain
MGTMTDEHTTAPDNVEQTSAGSRPPEGNDTGGVRGKRPERANSASPPTAGQAAGRKRRAPAAGATSAVGVTESPDGLPSQPEGSTPPAVEAFADERDDVLTVIHELEEQLDRYEDVRTKLERELAEANRQNQTAQQRVQELEWQTTALQTRVEALEHVRHESALLEEEIADVQARAQRLAEQNTHADKENARLAGELKSAHKQLEELWTVRKERDGLRVDLRNGRAAFNQLERDHKEALDERGTLQSKLQEIQATLDQTRTAKHQLETNLRATTDRYEELRRGHEDAQQKLEAYRAEKKNLQAQLTHMERQNARLIEQQQFYECELMSLRSMNRNAESALANVKRAFSEVRAALGETKTRARRRVLETWPPVATTFRTRDEFRDTDADLAAVGAPLDDATDSAPAPDHPHDRTS